MKSYLIKTTKKLYEKEVPFENYDFIEKETIFKYWNTLTRKNINDIPMNKLIKKPYLEKYIIKLSPEKKTKNQELLAGNILNLYENNIIKNHDLYIYICNCFELEISQKNSIQKFMNDLDSKNHNAFIFEILIYQINYFRFYMTISELLFNNNEEDNELYNFILIFIKNNDQEIPKYKKKNIKFLIFFNILQNLLISYKNIFEYLVRFNLLAKNENDSEIINFFLKNIFSNWYIIYKKDVLEDNVNDKIKEHKIEKFSILSKILCLPNL
jgi:hypothetical protein